MKRSIVLLVGFILAGTASANAPISGRFKCNLDSRTWFVVERQISGFVVKGTSNNLKLPDVRCPEPDSKNEAQAWVDEWLHDNRDYLGNGVGVSTGVLVADPYHETLFSDSATVSAKFDDWMDGQWDIDPPPAFENGYLGFDGVP